MGGNGRTPVACKHCRGRATISSNPTHKQFRCADCKELTPITVGIALARNLDEEKRQADRRWTPVRALVALVGTVIGLGGIAVGTYLQGGCAGPQSSYTAPTPDTSR